MPVTSQVIAEEVFAACRQIMAAGKNPSFPLVYEQLGRKGSAKTVQNMMAKWRKELVGSTEAERKIGDLPQALVTACDQFAIEFHRQAMGIATAVFDGERTNLAEERKKLADTHAAIQKQVEAVEARNLELTNQVSSLLTQIAEKEQSILEKIGDYEATVARITEQNAQITARAQEAEAISATERSRLEAELAEMQRAIAAERKELATERQFIHQETDRVRNEANLRLKSATGDLNAERDRSRQLAEKATALQTENELIKRTNTALLEASRNHTVTMSRYSEQIGSLTAQLDNATSNLATEKSRTDSLAKSNTELTAKLEDALNKLASAIPERPIKTKQRTRKGDANK